MDYFKFLDKYGDECLRPIPPSGNSGDKDFGLAELH